MNPTTRAGVRKVVPVLDLAFDLVKSLHRRAERDGANPGVRGFSAALLRSFNSVCSADFDGVRH